MRECTINGILCVYVEDIDSIDPFLKDICKILNIMIPKTKTNDVEYIKREMIQRLKKCKKDSDSYGWSENPDRMGRY